MSKTKILNVKIIVTNNDGSGELLNIDGNNLIEFNTEAGYETYNGGNGYMEAVLTEKKTITLIFHESDKSKWFST